MYTPISESLGKEKLILKASAATVGRPSGVNGKKMAPRRARVTGKELEKLTTKGLKAGGPGSGRHKVYGAITNVKTGKDLDWSGADHTKALSDLKTLGGTTYGKHWKMAGDLDVHDKEAGINVNHANGSEKFFHGKDAISRLKDHLEKLK